MKVSLLKHVWKGMSDYSYAYIMITNKYDIEDIIAAQNNGKKIVLWGWRPDNFSARCILEERGIKIDYACDITQTTTMKFNGIHICDYKKMLETPDEFYFIVALQEQEQMEIAVKLLQYSGVDEFGIIFSFFSKDFEGSLPLQNAFYETLNEIFVPLNFLNNFDALENLRIASLEGAGYWDVPYMWIYKFCKKKKKRINYLEVGPGIGVMSLSLKKLLDIEVHWIVIPDEEKRWKELHNNDFLKLINKHNIKRITGFIETDAFVGEYDIIVLAQVMEHFIYNPVNTLKKIAALLKDTGYIFISVPHEVTHYNVNSFHEMPEPDQLTSDEKIRRTLINNFGHFHEYSYDEAMEVFEESGLECVGYKWTPPIHHFMLRKQSPDYESTKGVVASLSENFA